MLSLDQIIQSISTPFEQIVVVGAGECAEYPSYKAKEPKRLTLVEPTPHFLQSAKQKINNAENVKYIEEAVWKDAQDRKLHISSIAEYTSFFRPQKLMEYYPNLQVSDTKWVQTITSSELIQLTGIDPTKQNLLVMDINGAEGELLKNSEKDFLLQFSHVIVRTSPAQLFEVDSYSAVINFLQQQSFDYLTIPESQPPYVNLVMQFDRKLFVQAREQIASAEKLRKVTDRLVAIESDIQDKSDFIKTLEQQLDQSDIALKAEKKLYLTKLSELESLNAELKNQAETITRDSQNTVSELAKANNKIAELQSIKQQLNEKAMATDKDLSDEKSKRTNLIEENKSLTEQVQILTRQQGETQAKADERNNQLQKSIDKVALLEKNLADETAKQSNLENDNNNLVNQVSALQAQLAAERTKFDQSQSKIQEVNGKLEALASQKASLNQEVEQQKQRVKTLTLEKEQVNQALEQAKLERERVRKQKQELDYRQQKLDAEIAKVEAQLELVKDIVLREKAF